MSCALSVRAGHFDCSIRRSRARGTGKDRLRAAASQMLRSRTRPAILHPRAHSKGHQSSIRRPLFGHVFTLDDPRMPLTSPWGSRPRAWLGWTVRCLVVGPGLRGRPGLPLVTQPSASRHLCAFGTPLRPRDERRACLRASRPSLVSIDAYTFKDIDPGERTPKGACALTCGYVPKRTSRRGSFGGSALVERQADDLIARVFRTCWRSRARVVLVQRVRGALVVGVGEACTLGPEDLLPVESHTHDFIGRYRTREGSPRRAR